MDIFPNGLVLLQVDDSRGLAAFRVSNELNAGPARPSDPHFYATTQTNLAVPLCRAFRPLEPSLATGP